MSTTPDPSMPVVAWANGDELDNMLDDRTATVAGQRSGERATALIFQRDAEAALAARHETYRIQNECIAKQQDELAALRERLRVAEDRVARLDEPWVDEHGTAWLAPTAWAYAQVCRVKNEMRERLEGAEKLLLKIRQDDFLTETTRHRIDAAIAASKGAAA